VSLSHRAQKSVFDPKKNLRSCERSQMGIKGAIFFPERQSEEECFVFDLSPAGAGIKSACSIAPGSRTVLYVAGLGRFEGKISRRDRLRIGLQFKFTDTKRERIAAQLSAFVSQGEVGETALRVGTRVNRGSMPSSFISQSGKTHACELAELTLIGASLKTDGRPDIGEIICFGSVLARVVRHTEYGIAVNYAESQFRARRILTALPVPDHA